MIAPERVVMLALNVGETLKQILDLISAVLDHNLVQFLPAQYLQMFTLPTLIAPPTLLFHPHDNIFFIFHTTCGHFMGPSRTRTRHETSHNISVL